MSIINPPQLIFSKNVFQWKGQYHCALSGVLGFELKDPGEFFSEQALRKLWMQLKNHNVDRKI